MTRSLMRGSILGILLLMMSSVPSVAADMSDTSWDLSGRSRGVKILPPRTGEGRDFSRTLGTMSFDADPDGTGDQMAGWSLVVQAIDLPAPLTGTWYDDGGRRFKGEVDEEEFTAVLEAFLSDMYGVPVDAMVVNVARNRIKGHVGRDGDRMRLKLRFKVDMEIDTPDGVITRRAWVKIGLRGDLVAGEPVF